MTPYVLFINQLEHSSLPYVGGKGANLGEMTKAGFPVPGGFCITTKAYRDFIATSLKMDIYFAELEAMDSTNLNKLRELGDRIRTHLQQLEMPVAIKDEILKALAKQGSNAAYAVRSSATAEDLPSASFAGQQDTYLNIKGENELLLHVRKCWASLFTDRAIAYRTKNGFVHREIYLSIVVQEMVIPDISGILFTADPINGNRNIVSIDASFGLGEALVSGMVSADLFKVKNGSIIHKKVSRKKLAIYSLPSGGTVTKDLPESQQDKQSLTDQQIIDLAALGKKIEQYYGAPQDIEFCMRNGTFFIVQSRPITTLYPLPDMPQKPLRVLLSAGHIQMMTDAMKPLGLSVLLTILPAKIPVQAGGRLFIDPTDLLHLKLGRRLFPRILTMADESMSRAVSDIINRPEFLVGRKSSNNINRSTIMKIASPIMRKIWKEISSGDPKQAKPTMESFMQNKFQDTRRALSGIQGAERIKVVQDQLGNLTKGLPSLFPYVAAGVISKVLLQKRLVSLQVSTADIHKLNVSLPGNITSEMGLRLGDLADLLRELPEVCDYLKTANDEDFYDGLAVVNGGDKFKRSFEDFLDRYGMRCPGEIDITNPRWRERPTQLLSALFSHMRSVKLGEHRSRFVEGEKEAEKAAQRILQQAKGNKRVARLISVFRYMGGLREDPKYFLITVIDECKKAIMAEAHELVKNGVLDQADDVYFFKLEELISILQGSFTGNVTDLIAERKEQYQRHQNLKPPRTMTSEGEIIIVSLRRDNLPEDVLIGSGVSTGVVEGIARVILRPENAFLNVGEILVAPQTDPGWTPLFQSAVAIVTEVGGLMTHGAVIAREYGIPAVVGVDEATIRIKDGERIRVDGDQGFVEHLE